MQNTDIFSQFRRKKTFDGKARTHPKVNFRILFDDYGAYLTVTDDKGKSIEANYLGYSGATRNLLRSVEQIQDKNSFVIDWEKPNTQLYLADHDYLIDQLRRVDKVTNAKDERLHFPADTGHIRLTLTKVEREGTLVGSTVFLQGEIKLILGEKHYDDLHLLNENTAISGTDIIDIQPVSEGFRNLSYFNTEVKEEDLPLYFSLLFSYLDNIEVVYEDYKVTPSAEKVFAKPALIFEKIDTDNALFMRVGQSLPNMDISVLEQFDLYRYAEINEIGKEITIKFVEQETIESVIGDIKKLLKKHTPRRKKSEALDVVLEDDLFIIPPEVAAEFIYNELPQLLLKYAVFGAEKLKSYKISAVQPQLNMNLSSGIDFLEGSVELDFAGEKIDLFNAIKQFRKNNYVKLGDGTHALLNASYLQKLERIFKQKGKKVQVSFFDLPLVEELIEEKVAEKSFAKSRKVYAGFNDIKSKRYRLPDINAKLRPYQKDGFKWLKYLHDNKLGGCLADDMGLGKTLQAIAILATDYPGETKPSLIVMPKSLLFNWDSEVRKFAPQLSTYTFYGNDRDMDTARETNLIFTTYAMMRIEIETFKEEKFHYVILDESQNIKNIQAQTTKAAMLLSGTHRLALSGTPIENNLGELYSLFRFLNPSMFGTAKNFNENYVNPIQKNNDKDAATQLRKKIFPFILRRMKKDVLSDLPDKIEQTLYIEMSPPQRKLYEERRIFYKAAIDNSIATRGLQQSRFFIFQAMNELRQIASTPEQFSDGKIISPKRELLEEQLADVLANNHKALIFVNFLAAIELISEQLEAMGIDYVSMTGATRNRQNLVQKFQTDPNCRVFLMTLKTGGTGLNLTAADTIFIFDPWWNAAAESQAIDRAHRMGQKNKVLAYKLITQDTIEEKIIELQEKKKELFDNVISADGASLKAMSEDDIDFILG